MSTASLAAAFDTDDVTPLQKLLLITAADALDPEGCYPCDELTKLQTTCGFSLGQLENVIRHLRRKGHVIDGTGRDGRPALRFIRIAESTLGGV